MKVYIDIHDKRWKKYKIDFAQIANAVVGAKYKNAEVSIVLVDDNEIKQYPFIEYMPIPTKRVSLSFGKR